MSGEEEKEIEEFLKKIEEQIYEEMRKIYGQKAIELLKGQVNRKRLEKADGYAKVKGTCGDTMEMFLRVNNDVIEECTFETDGCGSTQVCGSAATSLAQGKTILEALGLISADNIIKFLGGLPESDIHCAQLAAETLRRAIADYLGNKSAPWRKLYRP
jgi:nitrogen fixation NifU-like protein